MKRPHTLIQIFSSLFIIIGSLALNLYYLTSWANSLLFDTNYYLSIVTPLPKNPEVAKAMSTFTIDALFSKGDIEKRINNALPEQAKFLSSSLSDQLQTRSYQRTTQIIQSDQFSSVWVAANTVFHQRLFNSVRGGSILPELNKKQFLEETSLEFNGEDLVQVIKNRFGSDSQLFTKEKLQQFKSITLPLYSKLQTIRQIVYWIAQLSSMLLPFSLACILYGIAIAFSRQKAFLLTGIVVVLSIFLMLLTIQIIKTDFLNQITQSSYNSAAGVVWDSFLGGLKMTLWLTTLGGLLVIVLALIAGPYQWAENFRRTIGIPQTQKSGFMTGFIKIRLLVARYGLWLRILGVIIVILSLLALANVTISTVVIALSWLLIYLAILSFLFPRPPLN